MKTLLISYATGAFRPSQDRLNLSGLANGANQVRSYSPVDIFGTPFYDKNKGILKEGRGAGYWLWKPYIILDALNSLEDGDVVLYCDAGIEVISPLSDLISVCLSSSDVGLFNCGDFVNKEWTKRDCFVFMGCDESKYWEGRHLNAGIQVYRNSEKSRLFVMQYLSYCEDRRILSDDPNVCGDDNLVGFRAHRHDQSVLSILAIRAEIEVFRDPCQWGNYLKAPEFRQPGEFLDRSVGQEYSDSYFMNSPYGTIINHHRQRLVWVEGSKRHTAMTKEDFLIKALDFHREGKINNALDYYNAILRSDKFDFNARRLSFIANQMEKEDDLLRIICHCSEVLFFESIAKLIEIRKYVQIGEAEDDIISKLPDLDIALHFRPTRMECQIKLKAIKKFFMNQGDYESCINIKHELYYGSPDISYIAGRCDFETALRDFIMIERASEAGSIIIVGGIHPAIPSEATRICEIAEERDYVWKGDVYKIFFMLRQFRPDLDLLPIGDVTGGILLVSNCNPRNRVLSDHLRSLCVKYSDFSFEKSHADLYRSLRSRESPEFKQFVSRVRQRRGGLIF